MNLNELAKEICKREQGVGKGLTIAQVKTVIRHLGDIELELMCKDFSLKPERFTPIKNSYAYSKIYNAALRRAKNK